jgi:hypothetical protein
MFQKVLASPFNVQVCTENVLEEIKQLRGLPH